MPHHALRSSTAATKISSTIKERWILFSENAPKSSHVSRFSRSIHASLCFDAQIDKPSAPLNIALPPFCCANKNLKYARSFSTDSLYVSITVSICFACCASDGKAHCRRASSGVRPIALGYKKVFRSPTRGEPLPIPLSLKVKATQHQQRSDLYTAKGSSSWPRRPFGFRCR